MLSTAKLLAEHGPDYAIPELLNALTADYWLEGNRVKVNSRSPASSRLSATARHFSHHLRMNDLRRVSISCGVPA